MHTFLDSKAMARALRAALAERQIEFTHSECLELVARQFGLDNWNILAARIEAATAGDEIPPGWVVGGSNPDLYRIGIDPEGQGVVRLERQPGTGDATSEFATLMQSIDATEYVGRALRFTTELRSESAGKGALWMRVDSTGGGPPLRFDNMYTRKTGGPVVGDSPWIRRQVILDVPEGAGSIHFGVILAGGGRLWMRNASVDSADPSEVTLMPRSLPRRPSNLGFGAPA